MTIALALEYIKGRMAELGYGTFYQLRFRHLVLRAMDSIQISADTHFFILVNAPVMVSVESECGVYDLTVDHINELQYEHQGWVSLRNYANRLQHIEFIQVIPKQQ